MAKGKVPTGAATRVNRDGGAEAAPAAAHKPVKGTAKRARGGERAVAFGAEYVVADQPPEAAGQGKWWEGAASEAVPAGVLSYGDTLDTSFERLRARVLTALNRFRDAETGAVAESVFGVDTRVQVHPTSDSDVNYPYCAICFLVSEFPLPNGGTVGALGTGWIIAKRTIITAGHCVYANGPDFQQGGTFANRVAVFPARDGSTINYGPFEALTENLRTTDGWAHAADSRVDYGAIILPEETELPGILGAFGYDSDLSPALRDGPFHVAGYPGEFQKTDKAATMWEDAGTLLVQGPRLAYRIDTTPGQSGAPVYYIHKSDKPEERYAVAVGIHNYGFPDPTGQRRIKFPESQAGYNTATYIVGQVKTNLDSWQNEGGGLP